MRSKDAHEHEHTARTSTPRKTSHSTTTVKRRTRKRTRATNDWHAIAMRGHGSIPVKDGPQSEESSKSQRVHGDEADRYDPRTNESRTRVSVRAYGTSIRVPAASGHAWPQMATVHGWVSRERVRGFSRVLRHAFDRLVRSGRAEELMGGQQAAAAEGARPTARTRDVRSYKATFP